MQITARIAAYLFHEEALVPEAYLDSDTPPNWTWAGGLTEASGVKVQQYINRPAPLDVCVRATLAMVTAKYLPNVARAFAGHALNDAQLAGALSFEWNTDAIGRADWVRDWTGGNIAAARHDLTGNYLQGGKLTARRAREAALFFTNTWPTDMHCLIYQVSKPGYRPIKPVATDLTPILQQILGGA